jgi:hypothetical protein
VLRQSSFQTSTFSAPSLLLLSHTNSRLLLPSLGEQVLAHTPFRVFTHLSLHTPQNAPGEGLARCSPSAPLNLLHVTTIISHIRSPQYTKWHPKIALLTMTTTLGTYILLCRVFKSEPQPHGRRVRSFRQELPPMSMWIPGIFIFHPLISPLDAHLVCPRSVSSAITTSRII